MTKQSVADMVAAIARQHGDEVRENGALGLLVIVFSDVGVTSNFVGYEALAKPVEAKMRAAFGEGEVFHVSPSN